MTSQSCVTRTHPVSSNDALALADTHIEQAHNAVSAASGHVVRVRVHLHGVHVGCVAREYSHRLRLVHDVQARSAVRAAGHEVVARAQRPAVHTPHRERVPAIHHQVAPRVQTPEAHTRIDRRREQQLPIRRNAHARHGVLVAHQRLAAARRQRVEHLL